MCGGCLSVAYTLTGVRGNDDDDEELKGLSFYRYTVKSNGDRIVVM